MRLQVPDAISCVWLFGSFSRHSERPDSDLDLLVVTSDPDEITDEQIFKELFSLPREPEVSYYTRAGIERIIRPPSLFAWHLRLEGTPLLDRGQWLSQKLGRLGRYDSHATELEILMRLQRDVCESIESDAAALVFDAAVLATVARNAALLLSDLSGVPDFSPFSPLALRAHPVAPFPLTSEDYLQLRQCRLAVERGLEVPTVSRDELKGVVRGVDALAGRAAGVPDEEGE